MFYSCNQKPQQTIDEWVTELRLSAQDCKFHDSDDTITDRILMGTNSEQVQKKLLETPDLNLNKALTLVRAIEASNEQLKVIAGTASTKDVGAIKKEISTKEIIAEYSEKITVLQTLTGRLERSRQAFIISLYEMWREKTCKKPRVSSLWSKML